MGVAFLDRGDRAGRAVFELSDTTAGSGVGSLEQDFAGECGVAAVGEQVAGDVQVDVVVGGEQECVLFGAAGAEELLEAPVVDRELCAR